MVIYICLLLSICMFLPMAVHTVRVDTYSDPTRRCVCAHVLGSYLLHGGMQGPWGVATLVCMGSATDQGLW